MTQTPEQRRARGLVVFLAHYAGWPVGATLHTRVEDLIGKHAGP